MSRLTKAEWKAEELKCGKSCAIMKEFEKVIAEYGEQALAVWRPYVSSAPTPPEPRQGESDVGEAP